MSVRAQAWLLTDALVIAAVCAWLAPNAWVARACAGRLFASPAEAPARTFAIVPGSRVEQGKPGWVLRDRLQSALSLYQAGRVKAVLVSGRESPDAPEATAMRDWLLARGVPAADIFSDGSGVRTRETMVRAVARYGVADAIVCTQWVNAGRTLYLARAAGIDAVVVGTPSSLESARRYLAVESLKTTLAFAEATFRPAPARAATVLAAR
jgi:vancomycin permeability regulator SanA